jgi:hypothetical protein
MIIEVSLLIYTLVRYKMSAATRIIATMLCLLAAFQLAEFNVCSSSPGVSIWSRFGFIAITLLPALGIHLVIKIAQRNWRWLVWTSYSFAFLFAVIFGLGHSTFASHVCSGNYVIFQLSETIGGAYFIYYYSMLFVGILLSLHFINKAQNQAHQALVLQIFGYLTFLLPTIVVNTVNPSTISGIPSIMCGFAVLYACILGFGIAPRVLSPKNN